MRIAVISDIHSNSFALQSVINDLEKQAIQKIMVLGDIFGYYPWAVETYRLLKPYLDKAICISGNHDKLLLSDNCPEPVPSYWIAAQNNREDLQLYESDALEWLKKLSSERTIKIDDLTILLCHGTPDDPENGRFYPDNSHEYDWFPKEDEVVLLGHTHYPVLKRMLSGGVIFNPGSVGQARDGNPMPSWGIVDTDTLNFTLMRSAYNNLEVIELLKKQNWDARAIAALNKTNKGALK